MYPAAKLFPPTIGCSQIQVVSLCVAKNGYFNRYRKNTSLQYTIGILQFSRDPSAPQCTYCAP